ncbi:ankyrin repeat and LEM domain-containing protein 2 homolog [Anopheles nili]|uniref:ankyrin repeat and LEM domain-containing protein 2 homolog n=1 Tax=Anopheles nili TaxID=185578 RepID=UPI00237B4B64|nr:ankyrin repeat and LEM domain-containing protein 2 homolog [Anopheles nili]
MEYYAIYIPDNTSNFSIKSFYNDKAEALSALKLHKEARMKAFSSSEEAISFFLHGPSEPAVPGAAASVVQSPKSKAIKSLFVAPTSQKLVAFRKLIEANDVAQVRYIINTNPRYLISSGDTPTIMKEGPRYNALHITAIHGRSEICRLILQTIENAAYIEMLHGQQTPSTTEVSAIMLDLYLNTPDKCRNETPLHFAAKHGWTDVVKELIAYPQCQINPNSDGLYPKDIVCSRAKPANNTPEVCEAICALLKDNYFVPVIRTQDNVYPPAIGKPFSPTYLPSLDVLANKLSPLREIKAYAGPMDREKADQFCKRWKTPPRLLVMESNAQSKGRSTTPPGVRCSSTPIKAKPRQLFANNSFEMKLDSEMNANMTEKLNNNDYKSENSIPVDTNENMDVNGNDLYQLKDKSFARDTATPHRLFHTYRKLLNDSFDSESSFCDGNDDANFSYVCEESRTLHDKIQDSQSFKERSIRLNDLEKGLETVGRTLALKENVGWKEYWNFLGKFCNLADDAGLDMLDKFLAQKRMQDKNVSAAAFVSPSIFTKDAGSSHEQSFNENLNKICESTEKLTLQDTPSHITKKAFGNDAAKGVQGINQRMPLANVYSCVLNSLQIFGTRFAKNLFKSISPALKSDSNLPIHDVIHDDETYLELIRKLEKLLENYQNDSAFQKIDFSKAHSMFAYLIVVNIPYGTDKEKQEANLIFQGIKKLLSLEQTNEQYSRMSKTWRCVASFVSHYFDNIEQMKPCDFENQTEQSFRSMWNDDCRIIACVCRIDAVSHSGRGILERMSKRREKRANRLLSEPSEAIADFVTYRNPAQSSELANRRYVSSDDDELYYSCDSEGEEQENETFFTPPSSPKPLPRRFINTNAITGNRLGGEEQESDVPGVITPPYTCEPLRRFKFPNNATPRNRNAQPASASNLVAKTVSDESVDAPMKTIATRDEGYTIFISGTKPSKEDFDVFMVLKDLEIDQHSYPHIFDWKNEMKKY